MRITNSSLASLSSLITKGTTPTTLGYTHAESGIPFLRVQNIFGGQVNFEQDTLFIDKDTHVALKRSQIKGGDVLVTIAGTIGRVGVVPVGASEMNCNQAIAIVRPTEEIERSYLRHWLESQNARNQILGSTVTGTISNLSLSQLGKLQVPLPPREEQRRIAGILDKADALRAKRREALTQLDHLAQSIFVEMFGDSGTNPRGLPMMSIRDIAEVQGGLQVTSARKNQPVEVPYLRVANVYRGRLQLDEIKTIRATSIEVARTKLAPHDMLIVEGHGNPAEIGRAALWNGEIAECVHQNHLIRVRFDQSKAVPAFVCAYLNSPGGRRHLVRAGKTTSGLNTISVSNVREAPIALPAITAQRAFAERLSDIDHLKSKHCLALTESDALFTTLQERAFGKGL